jgi:hypothetical protein
LCGLVIGGLTGLVLGWRIILRRAAQGDTRWIVLWLLAWAVGGAVIAVLRIPQWQRPGYKGIRDADDDRETGGDYSFKRVAPEFYNRVAHPSLKQLHDFVRWLREATVAELERTRGDIDATKAAFVLFFRRGFKAGLFLPELTEMLPSIVSSVGYSEAEYSVITAMLKALDLEELGANFPSWAVWRQDDSGNKFLMEANLTEEQARSLVADFESKGHKQTYWCSNERMA